MILVQSVLAQTFSNQVHGFHKKYEFRFNELKVNNFSNIPETFSLENKIRSEMEKTEINKTVKRKPHKPLLDFSSVLRVLIDESEVYLKNEGFKNESLFATNLVYFGDCRRVFTWRPEGVPSNSKWKFTTINGGRTFYIRNVAYDECLTESDWDYDENRRFVYTSKCNEAMINFEWLIESINDYTLRLMNLRSRDYLSAAIDKYAYNDELRSVFTWMGLTDFADRPYVWKLEKV